MYDSRQNAEKFEWCKETYEKSISSRCWYYRAYDAGWDESFVHMDDFNTNNIMAEGTRITEFIDLEMTRPGNEILLLGAALCSMCFRPCCSPPLHAVSTRCVLIPANRPGRLGLVV